MKLSRVRTGEGLALAGAIALAVLLCLDWFFLSTPDARVGAHESGWRSMGWPITLLLLAAIGTALAMVFTTATQRAQGWPIVLTVFTFVLGTLGTLAVAIRLIAQPGLGVDAGNVDVEIEPAAWLGLLSVFAIGLGGWIGELDERTDAPESLEQTEDVLRVRGAPRRARTPPDPVVRTRSPIRRLRSRRGIPLGVIDRDQVLHVARLAKLSLSEEEVERMSNELSGILDHIEKIGELDLQGVPPTSHVVELTNALRADVPRPSWPREEVLAAAPEATDEGFAVPSPQA